jgi:hypothetical protein
MIKAKGKKIREESKRQENSGRKQKARRIGKKAKRAEKKVNGLVQAANHRWPGNIVIVRGAAP